MCVLVFNSKLLMLAGVFAAWPPEAVDTAAAIILRMQGFPSHIAYYTLC
jgi:hypothetical protein